MDEHITVADGVLNGLYKIIASIAAGDIHKQRITAELAHQMIDALPLSSRR
ncbi:MAG: hypothetical protein U0670_10990 [Anaerolineae bacterium]